MKKTGITEATLYKWRKEARAAGNATPGNGQTSDKWSSQDKFLVVMETFSMNESELADYCRRKGLYREQMRNEKKFMKKPSRNSQSVGRDKHAIGQRMNK